MNRILQRLRVTAFPENSRLSDAQLLDCFIAGRDESAFATLVRRHGPMVWGVCRRVLRSHHDAEDAFQATFLVLVRKAGCIRSRKLLANWLYGVAHRTALKVNAMAAKRNRRQRQVRKMPEVEVVPSNSGPDLYSLLDRELSILPEKYRVVIVLCDLENKTRREAARQLGVPEGTVAGRLARARALLAKRLTRKGLPTGGVALAGMFAETATSACVPAPVLTATVQAAAVVATGHGVVAGAVSPKALALVEGVLGAMFLTKLKVVALILVAAATLGTGIGAGSWTYQAQAQEQPQDGGTAQSKQAGEDREMRRRREELERRLEELEASTTDDTCLRLRMALLKEAVSFYRKRLEMLEKEVNKNLQDQRIPGSHTDHREHPVAFIYDKTPISRADLGEYLIARFGEQRLDALINQRIIDRACKTKNIVITDQMVMTEFQENLREFGLKGPNATQDFQAQLLRRFGKTVYEWKEDVIRPKLALRELARPRVVVAEKDLREAFEARYGEKRQCRMIVLPAEMPDSKKREKLTQVQSDESAFLAEAGNQFLEPLRQKKGLVPPVHRHFPDQNIERAAFSLDIGAVSGLIPLPDKTVAILRCEKFIPPDRAKLYENERRNLHKEVYETKLQQEIPKMFEQMRREANVRLLMSK
jgi:RNA polymerase sigma factor (sigma-70 family)